MPSADFLPCGRISRGLRRLLSRRSGPIYVIRHMWQLEDFRLCCTLVPVYPASNRVLVHPPVYLPQAPQGALTSCTFAFGYTLALPTCDWTNSLKSHQLSTYTWRVFEFRYARGAHQQAAGHARHTTIACTLLREVEYNFPERV